MYADAARRAGMKPARIIEFDDSPGVIDWLRDNLSDSDAALVKGSHGLRMDRIVAALEDQS
jgi:UDP-N-acetylmuramoyl-tripeptide--D-alanyl-D-alanine ligase